jgi:capsid assembly protease
MESYWAVHAEFLPSIAEGIRHELAARGELQGRDVVAGHSSGGVALLRLSGVITQRSNIFTMMFGGTSTESFSERLRAAVSDPSVGTIVIDVDSPGGGVYGIHELATEIYNARKQKRIVAQINSLGASAAYWIASAAHQINVTPSGELGSIGVFAVHYDVSRANEKLGINPTYISAGKFKVESRPDSPLDEGARDYMQKRVDDYYGQFVDAVAKGRGVTTAKVRSGFGEGRVVGAADSVRLGMADRVSTLSETLQTALAGTQKPQQGLSQFGQDERMRRLESLIDGNTESISDSERRLRLLELE